MKFLSIMILLSFSAITMAEDSFTCKTTTMASEDKKVEIKVDKNIIEIEGLGKGPIIEKVSMNMNGEEIQKCLSCPDNALECLKNQVPDAKNKDDSRLSLHTNLIAIGSPLDDKNIGEILGMPTSKDIDVSKIKSGTIHVLQFGGFYPNLGVYEYFDGEGKLLGRMFHEVLPRMCK